jgi:HlyD family secretion protein
MKRAQRMVLAASVMLISGAYATWSMLSGSGDDSIFVSGTIEATEAELGFQIAGRLDRVVAREGDELTPGQEAAVLDQAELLAERAVIQAQMDGDRALLAELVTGSRKEEVARARAMLTGATERRNAARRDVQRLRALAEQSLISKQAFDQAETSLSVADGEVARSTEELRLLEAGTRPERIAAQQATLAQSQSRLAKIDAQIAQSRVVAPFAGTVTVRHREPGEAIAPGTPVLTLRNLDDRWVRVYVPGDEVGRLSIGQCAAITADAFAERTYVGKISYIASVAEFTPRNVQSTKDRVRLVYEVRVRIVGDLSVDLKPGLPGDVTFATPPQGTSAACTATGAIVASTE